MISGPGEIQFEPYCALSHNVVIPNENAGSDTLTVSTLTEIDNERLWQRHKTMAGFDDPANQ
ncbi:MAG: hypothetical protein V7700_15215 [Halioglobus sp.]